MRIREYLAAVKPDGLFLMLDLMHFASEVLEPEGLKTPFGLELSSKEMGMAKSLIETMAGDWEPEKYADQYQDALKELIDRKVQHLPAAAKAAKPRIGSDYPDILAILQQSIAQGTDKREKAGERPTRPKTTSALVRQKRPSGAMKK